jgi:nondiscriminating aspartyl-tRNA synthetase
LDQLNLKDISEGNLEKEICTYGRVHKIRALGKRCFIILRDQIWSIQCVMCKGKDTVQFKSACKVAPESFIRVTGTLSRLPEQVSRVEYTYYKNFELKVSNIELISKSTGEFPFTLEDANELYSDSGRNKVLLHTRLDSRPFDLRAPFNNCIFRVQSAVCQLFREYLVRMDFMEIHTPKIIGTASEGGAAVFAVDYFKSPVYLAQSPQLYKQMCINSDFNRVFEIGPVFRAENCVSNRHLCEYVSLDIEMAITPGSTYYEIIQLLWGLLVHIFDNIKVACREQIKYIKSIHKFDDAVYPREPLIINFKDAVKLLRDAGYEQGDLDDLSSKNEKKLGEIILKEYGSDLFVLDKYPLAARPFYTMPAENKDYSNSYDVIFRGQEISSGSQRVHNLGDLLSKLDELKLDETKLSDYLKSFSYGSRPHGGCGLGLERIVMLYLNLENIREVSLYPRDPYRVAP